MKKNICVSTAKQYFNYNKDENAHRYAVRGKKIERERQRKAIVSVKGIGIESLKGIGIVRERVKRRGLESERELLKGSISKGLHDLMYH